MSTPATASSESAFDAWNPGLESTIPDELRPLCTLHRAENVSTAFSEARELQGLTGLDIAHLVVFRPARLALHEVLIRVSADLTVPEGERVEDLGINFREMTSRIMARLQPRMAEIERVYAERRREVSAAVAAELARITPENAPSFSSQALSRGSSLPSPAARAALGALARVVSAILVRHGRLWGPREVIATLAAGIASNELCSDEIGRLLAPWFVDMARLEGFRLLPSQERPVVMNTKGASAAGKTTIRPLQRKLAAEIGCDWSDFALISPDIWRKQLLDYASLGAAFKYAGPFTGEELRIVDQKLDLYMAAKAAAGRMPHLLIDRFRFDSFAPHSEEAGSNLLTRFGRVVYLFFMITPPASLVERAWNRGLEVGRYKAVDDTLAHSVEAYSGMPQLFFTWAGRTDKRVHFEFLDNAVAAGRPPRTVAFGWNDVLHVLDVRALLEVERFRHVRIHARSQRELFPDAAELAPERNLAFLRACIQRFPRVDFVDGATGQIYLRVGNGAVEWVDPAGLADATRDADVATALRATLPAAFAAQHAPPPQSLHLPPEERRQTVGTWGGG